MWYGGAAAADVAEPPTGEYCGLSAGAPDPGDAALSLEKGVLGGTDGTCARCELSPPCALSPLSGATTVANVTARPGV